jgi:nucleotide-binding universal stress UspA family protein
MERWEQHDSYVKELRKTSKDLLDQCKSKAKELGVTKIDIISEEGNAAEKVLQIADDKEVDIIVVGSRDTN